MCTSQGNFVEAFYIYLGPFGSNGLSISSSAWYFKTAAT